MTHGPLMLNDRMAQRLMNAGISGAALLLLPPLASIAIAAQATSEGALFANAFGISLQNRKSTMLNFR